MTWERFRLGRRLRREGGHLKTCGCVADSVFPGRREVKRLTGNHEVPTLVLDDGTIIDGSQAIIAWASHAHEHTSR